MKRFVGTTTAAVVLLLAASPAWAVRTRTHEKAESLQYGEKAVGMIGRGLLNGVTCFVDPLVQTVNETKAGPPVIGTLRGAAQGLGCGVLRLGSGVVDVVTFWVPGFNGMPVSDSYENCLATGEPSSPAPVAAPAENWQSPPAAVSEPMPATEPAPEAAPAHKKYYKK